MAQKIGTKTDAKERGGGNKEIWKAIKCVGNKHAW